MLGIPDPGIWIAYVLCLLSTALCVVYGVMRWNMDIDEKEPDEKEKHWAEEEKQIEEEL